MASYTVDTVIKAPRERVYTLFADREGYPKFLPLSVKLKRPGTTERQGVDAIHQLGAGPIGLVCEQITELDPNRLIRYRVVAGMPVKSHIGAIELSDADGGTRVRYTMASEPKLPVPAPLLTLLLRGLITVFVSGVRRAAER